jgi:hypothetical protein
MSRFEFRWRNRRRYSLAAIMAVPQRDGVFKWSQAGPCSSSSSHFA